MHLKEEGVLPSKLLPVSHLHVEGRQYPVNIFYLQDPIPCYVQAARETVFKLHEDRPLGADILVFLTGSSFYLLFLPVLCIDFPIR